MDLRRLIRVFRQCFSYTPLIEVGISRANLLHNLAEYRRAYPGLSFAPALKSNAYGHDIGLIARLLDREDVAFFMVDSLYEAHVLRRAGIRSRIVVMGYVRPKDLARSRLRNTDYAITDIEQLTELAALARHPIRLHLKIDTGMHRQGVMPDSLDRAISLLRSNSLLTLSGICSHLSDADNADSAYTETRMKEWNECLARIRKSYPSIEYRHLAATKGIRFAKEAGTNVVRLGIGLYGFDTSPLAALELRPVLELRSVVASLRDIPAGDSVGYNATYTASRPTRLATVPLGYFEGVDRRLSNAGSMLIRAAEAPIAGRVSMNICSLDVTDIPDAERGDIVTVISRDPTAPNSAEALAAKAATIPYEILAHIPQHLRRVVE